MKDTLEQIPKEGQLIYIYNVARCNVELIYFSKNKRKPIIEFSSWHTNYFDNNNLNFQFWDDASEEIKKLI